MTIFDTHVFVFKIKSLILSILPFGKFYGRFFYLSVYFFLLLSDPLFSQTHNVASVYFPQTQFRHLSIEEGLSQNGAFVIEQDSKGFMWIGTKDGLNKYDGYSFTVFTHDPFDSTTLSGNYIGAVFEDSKGILWVITYEGKINLMDSKTELFRKIPVTIPYMTSIAEDKAGNIWIGSYRKGLFRIKREDVLTSSFRVTNYTYFPKALTGISDSIVFSLAVDGDGVLWIGTASGLDKLSPDSESFEHETVLNNKNPEGKRGHAITSILINNDSTLWLGSSMGLTLFNKNSRSFIYHPFKFKHNRWKYGEGSISNIVKDRDGNLFMHLSGYLVLFDVTNKTFNYFERDVLPAISKVMTDKAGNIWIGTSYGIYIYFPESNWFKSFPNKKYKKQFQSQLTIRAIFEDSQNNMWFASYNYIYKWNRKTNTLTTYGNAHDPGEFGSTGASSIAEDRNGNLWFATYEGLYQFITNTNKWTLFRINPPPYQAVNSVFVDKSGSIWTVDDTYLSKLANIEKGTFVNYRYNNTPNPGFSPGTSMTYQDGQGAIWFTTNMGLIKFNSQSEKFTVYENDPANNKSLYSNSVKSICPDPLEPDKKLWIGTSGGGLNLFDKQSETFTYIMEKDGLSNNVVYGILPDAEGNLWLSTNRGLSKYNPAQKQFINYTIDDGLQNNEFNTGAFFKSKSGEMFFGGISGFNYFDPLKIAKKSFKANIVFTNFKLFNKSVSVKDDNSILKKIISETNEIILPYNQNFISFEFASLDYYAPKKNNYAFKLEGFNRDWIQLGTKREVTFTNLRPGKYTLKVKGSNSDGIWNKNAVSFNIFIIPPWSQTWWAYAIYGIFFLASLYFIRRYELNRFLLKNDLKLEKVETDKLRNLDQLKSRFFTNISHEFRTPLTLIIGPLQQLLEKADDPESRRIFDMMQRNARRLLRLINQLLDISKLDAGKMALCLSRGDLVGFLQGIFASYETLAGIHNIKLEFISNMGSFIMLFDHDKMENIFHNLLSNALKFTGDGGHLALRIHIEQKTVTISVSDSGKGISKIHIKHIFDRFYQVDEQAAEFGGTGIGLSLARELVELLQGTITVESRPGAGTTFHVRLPVAHADLVMAPQQKDYLRVQPAPLAATGASEAVAPEQKNGIILVIEDNTEMRVYVRSILEQTFEVEEAEDGQSGLTKAIEIIPDLIVSDLMMPEMDGYTLCRSLRGAPNTSHIPIIMLTAKATEKDKLIGLQAGVDDYLTKPFQAKELLARVKNLIAVRKKLIEALGRKALITPAELAVTPLDQEFLGRVRQVIEQNMTDEKFNLELLCNLLHMGERQFRRKIKALIGQSPNQVIRQMRLERARQLLEKKSATIAEVSFRVGFNSPAYFSKVFRDEFGILPSEIDNS